MPSEPPVNQYDPIRESPSRCEFFQLYQHNKVIDLVQVSSCAAKVRGIWDLSATESMMNYSYLNFAIYEDPS